MTDFESKLGYPFTDRQLLKTALTHSSYANEHHCEYNERMEFLGDSVLSLVVSTYLYQSLAKENEGNLSKLRASLVCEPALAALARKIDLGTNILLGKGEENTGGRDRDSVLSDAYEAIIAAIYLDSDLETVRKWLLEQMHDALQAALHGGSWHDYKTTLQEIIQKHSRERIVYTVIAEQGPDHHKDFSVQVTLGEKVIGAGSGQSKKEAEQNAAKNALEKMHHEAL